MFSTVDTSPLRYHTIFRPHTAYSQRRELKSRRVDTQYSNNRNNIALSHPVNTCSRQILVWTCLACTPTQDPRRTTSPRSLCVRQPDFVIAIPLSTCLPFKQTHKDARFQDTPVRYSLSLIRVRPPRRLKRSRGAHTSCTSLKPR